MGGSATFSGTTYQARVLAYAEVHMLAQSPLGWLPTLNDTPIAVSGETLGPGDDVRVEFGAGLRPLEAQVKHGINAAGDLDEVIVRLRDAWGLPSVVAGVAVLSPSLMDRVVLVVDRGSTRGLYTDFAEDLTRLRSGRSDGARPILRRLLTADAQVSPILERLFVVAADLDHSHNPEWKHALALLRGVLEDSAQADSAWDALVADAHDVCAQRLRRDRPALVRLLEARGMQVRAPAPEERWMRQLDFTRDLLLRWHAAAAMSRLRQIDTELRDTRDLGVATAGPDVRYRLLQQQAAAYRQLDRSQEAREYAERALDVNNDGLHALVLAAAASTDLGDLTAASAFARRAIAAHPAEASAWTALMQVARVSGEAIPSVPPDVEASAEFRTVQAHMAMAAADWATARNLTSALIAEGVRTNDVLALRALSLTNATVAAGPSRDAEVQQALRDIERLATDGIEQIANELHPLTSQLYVARAWARRQLGRSDEADADLAEARRIDHEDPNAIWHAVAALLEQGRDREALAMLRDPVVDQDARLLSMRAYLLGTLDHLEEARDALQQLDLLRPPQSTSTEVHARTAETALLLGDVERARAAVARIAPSALTEPSALLACARLAATEGDIDRGVELYRAAAMAEPTNRLPCLAEGADRLRRAGRIADAVVLFRDAIGSHELGTLPEDISRSYAIALMRGHHLVEAQELVDAMLSSGPDGARVSSWVLALATEIARSRDDVDAAIQHLESLCEQERADPRVRIELTRWLLEVGRLDDAVVHLRWLREHKPTTPELCVAMAQLLVAAGRVDEGLQEAFRAFREGGDQPALHRAFVSLVLSSGAVPPARDAVEGDTHVCLSRTSGERWRVTVYSTPPIDPRRDEMSVAGAEEAGILGKSVGDIVVRFGGTWREERWRVESLMPAIQFAALDAAEHFSERFPGEPFFVVGIPVGDSGPDSTLTLVQTMRASLLERQGYVRRIFEMYRAGTLPLGFVAHALGGSVVDAMRFLSHEVRLSAIEQWPAPSASSVGREEENAEPAETPRDESPAPSQDRPASDAPESARSRAPTRAVRPTPMTAADQVPRTPPLLQVEWADRRGVAESRAAARDARTLVLTRSAMETMEQLQITDLATAQFRFVAPRSLRNVLRREAVDAAHHVQAGYRNISAASHGLSLVDLAPGAPELERACDRAERRLVWFDGFVEVLARPLETIPAEDSPEAEARTLIGADSLDAVHLAQHLNATLYADDLGLRRFFPPGSAGRSCSTVGVLHALADREVLTGSERDQHLLSMLTWRYATIPASTSLLSQAVTKASALSTETLRGAFALLSAGEQTLDEASRMTVQILYDLASSPIRVLTVAAVTDLALEAIAARWNPRAAAAGVQREAHRRMRLMPLELDSVDERCLRFAREGTVARLALPATDGA